MSPDELARLVRSVHPDPHSLLGPHPDGEVFVVRVLRPDASEVSVLVGQKTRAVAKRIHPDGLFEARLRARPKRYELEVVTPEAPSEAPTPTPSRRPWARSICTSSPRGSTSSSTADSVGISTSTRACAARASPCGHPTRCA
jgi:hypothetical protein